MTTSIVRSRALIAGTNDRFSWNEIPDGAVLVEDGTPVEYGAPLMIIE